MKTENQSLHTLFGDALRESSELAQKEFALFRTEMSESVRRMFMGLAMVVVAAIFGMAALILFTDALVHWLAGIVGSEALAALIVGAAMAVIALGLGLWGRSAIASFSLSPRRTLRSVKRDAEVLSERVAQ